MDTPAQSAEVIFSTDTGVRYQSAFGLDPEFCRIVIVDDLPDNFDIYAPLAFNFFQAEN